MEICSGDIGGRDDDLRKGDLVVLKEDDLQLVVDVRVIIDELRRSDDEADDLLGADIARGGLGREMNVRGMKSPCGLALIWR